MLDPSLDQLIEKDRASLDALLAEVQAGDALGYLRAAYGEVARDDVEGPRCL